MHLGTISANAFSFLGSGLKPCLEMISSKGGTDEHLKCHFSFISVLLFCILISLFTVCFHDLCHHHHNLQLTCHQQFHTHSVVIWIFHLFFSDTFWKPLNASHLYLYLPNWHADVCQVWWLLMVSQVWYPEFASLIDKYFALVSLGNISLRVGPLWTGHIGAQLSLAQSKHNLTIPAFHLWTVMWWCAAAVATPVHP